MESLVEKQQKAPVSLIISQAYRIKNECLEKWFSEDGLMKLNMDEDRNPVYPFTKKSVGNDNGILFTVYFYMLCDSHGILDELDKQRFVNIVNDLRKRIDGSPVLGLFNRNPGRDGDGENLDNYMGLVCGAALFDIDSIPDEICNFGESHGYIFNNVNHGDWDIKYWRQGADVAVYKLLSMKRTPMVWEMIWLLGGIVFQSLQGIKDENGVKRLHTSEHLLMWIRLRAIEKVIQRGLKGVLWPKYYFWIRNISYLYRARLSVMTNGKGIEEIIGIYFNPASGDKHPIERLAEGITF